MLVNNPETWNAFEKELDERIQNSYRMQGQVHALNALKQLRLKVNADG